MVIVSLITDLRSRHILNVVTLPAMAAGFLAMAATATIQGRLFLLIPFVLAFLCSAGFCLFMEKSSIWAAGDSKLFLAVAVWMNGIVPPLWGTSLLIGWTASLHTGVCVIQFFARRNRRNLSMSWHYPGSMTIALASGMTLLLHEWMARGNW
ncbi:prepilin peptidase [Paenibacillus chartarius]|uniref:Prepilin peptidase n=1 Tax=Paenibacillus chartarius TaxID=747481 RepID=A0ABV6DMH9_9BACL